MAKKPAGYWQNINNIRIELDRFIDEDGVLCGYTEINANHPSLAKAMPMHHGGIQKVRETLGLTKKRCTTCGQVKEFSEYRQIRSPNARLMSREARCKKCTYKKVEDYRATGIGFAANICRFSKNSAKKKGIAYDIDKQWVLEKLNEIQWRCEVTGIPFERIGTNFFDSWSSVSIDRIDPKKGYTKDNVQFVTSWVNKAKSNLPMNLFIEYCEAVTNAQKKGV